MFSVKVHLIICFHFDQNEFMFIIIRVDCDVINLFPYVNIFLLTISRGSCQSRCAGAGFDSFKNLHKNVLLHAKQQNNQKNHKRSLKEKNTCMAPIL